MAICLSKIGRSLYEEGKYNDAEAYVIRAIAIQEERLGPHHFNLASSFTWLGMIWTAQGRTAAALVPLERALAIHEAAVQRGYFFVSTPFALARALWDAKRDRQRALVLARAARDECATLGPSRKETPDEIDRWRATR